MLVNKDGVRIVSQSDVEAVIYFSQFLYFVVVYLFVFKYISNWVAKFLLILFFGLLDLVKHKLG